MTTPQLRVIKTIRAQLRFSGLVSIVPLETNSPSTPSITCCNLSLLHIALVTSHPRTIQSLKMAASSLADPSTSGRATKRPAGSPKNWRFFLTMVSVCLMALVASVGSSIATALPRISRELNARQSYVWIASIYMFAQTAVQPPCAQLCNVFGRKNPMIISVLIFAAGSAVAGTSKSTAGLIAGRTVQGSASGCIMMLSELIICDLVPLRQRGKYVGFVLTAIALGTVVGPITGGALAERHWRWVSEDRNSQVLSMG